MKDLQHKLQVITSFSAVNPATLPMGLQKRRPQLVIQHVSLLKKVALCCHRRVMEITHNFTICRYQ